MPISPDDAAYCDREVRAHDPDRWLTALFVSDARRPAFHALLAFGGELSRTGEAASQPMLGEIRLQWWRETIDGVFAGSPGAHPIARALAGSVVPSMRGAMDAMIDAWAEDLYETPPPDLAGLQAFADATGGALAMLLLHVLEQQADPRLCERARKVGTAWTLVDTLIRLPHLIARRRLPLPADLLAREGTDPERVLAGLDASAVRRVTGEIAISALRLVERAREGEATPRSAFPVMAQARFVRRDVKALLRQGGVPGDPGPMPWRQISLLLAALRGRW